MSGLLAVYNAKAPTPWKAMLEEIRVLGPDATGEWHDRDRAISLGRAQLFDSPEAMRERPILVKDQMAVAFDGRLVEREPSDTRTDPEILLDVYEAHEEACVRRLRGEFAFVIWDGKRRRLFAACDAIGMRTLAYYASGETVLLCSRAVTLLRHPQVPRSWDEVYLANTLCDLWAHAPGSTPFASVRRLRPGWGVVADGGGIRLIRVDEIAVEPEPARRTPDAFYEEFRALFDASVRDRWRESVPTCIALSGGLDSSCVAASLLQCARGVDAFSMVVSDETGRFERELLESLLARYPEVRSRLVECVGVEGLDDSALTGPLPDDPMIPDIAIRAARRRLERTIAGEGFRVVFDGDGADELFEVWSRVGDLVRERDAAAALRWVLARRSPVRAVWNEILLPGLPAKVRAGQIIRRTVRSKLRAPWMTAAFRGARAVDEALREDAELEAKATLRSALPRFLEGGGMVPRVHSKRLGLASRGLEGASPFWDRRVVEFVVRLPAVLRVHPLPKLFVRRAFEGRLPAINVAHRKDLSWYLEMRRRSLTTPRAREVVQAIASSDHPLAGWIDVASAEAALETLAIPGADQGEPWTAQLEALVHLADWTERVSRLEFA